MVPVIALITKLCLLEIRRSGVPLAALSSIAPVWHELLFYADQCSTAGEWTALMHCTGLIALKLPYYGHREPWWRSMSAADMGEAPSCQTRQAAERHTYHAVNATAVSGSAMIIYQLLLTLFTTSYTG